MLLTQTNNRSEYSNINVTLKSGNFQFLCFEGGWQIVGPQGDINGKENHFGSIFQFSLILLTTH